MYTMSIQFLQYAIVLVRVTFKAVYNNNMVTKEICYAHVSGIRHAKHFFSEMMVT